MGALFSYSLAVSVLLCCGYGIYMLVSASARQHGYNRVMIYVIYISALTLPLVLQLINESSYTESATNGIGIGKITPLDIGSEPTYNGKGVNIRMTLPLIYILGMAGVSFFSLAAVFSLVRVISKGEKRGGKGFYLILSDDDKVAPFSWLRYVVINKSDLEHEAATIVIHEKRHIELYHWVDMLLAQVMICFLWYNPVAWLLRNELRIIHEYQADEAVMASGVNLKEYQMLLIKKAAGTRFQSLANSFNHSKLKKRITMMYKEKSTMGRRLGALLLVPAMALGCVLVQIPAFAGFLKSESGVSLLSSSDREVNKKTSYAESVKIGKKHARPAVMYAGSELNLPSQEASSEDATSSGVDMRHNDSRIDSVDIPVSAEEKTDEDPRTAAEVLAEPVGGMKAMLEFLHEHIQYPEEAVKENKQGRVVVRFVVGKDGTVSDPQIIRSVSPALDQEAIRVVGEMPKWKPATVDGEPVRTYYVLPINFDLPDNSNGGKAE